MSIPSDRYTLYRGRSFIKKPTFPKSDEARLTELKRFNVLDTLPEKIFDSITALASQICGTPIALVSLVDESRQWFKSHHGLSATETPRDISFCGHAITQNEDIFEITNSFEDPRFKDNPLVTGDPRVIFYAGAPLLTTDGHKVGTLCVIDHKPKQLTESQREALRLLANQVVLLFEMRTVSNRAVETIATQAQTASEQEKEIVSSHAELSKTSAERQMLESIFENSTTGLALVCGNDLVFEKTNSRFEALVGKRDYIGNKWEDVYSELRHSSLPSTIRDVLRTGERYEIRESELTVRNDEGALEKRYYNFSSVRVSDELGQPYGVIIQCVDLTADVMARRELAHIKNVSDIASKLLETTLTSIGDAVISTTADKIPQIRFLNKVAEELTGWKLEHAKGRPVSEVFDIVNARTRAKAVDPISKVISTGKTQGLANHTALISKSGREYIIEDSAAPLHDDAGKVIGVVLVFRDVTAKHALEERAILLNAVIESSKDFIGIAGGDGNAFYVNPAGRKYLGISGIEDVSKTKIIDYFAETEKPRIIEKIIPEIVRDGAWDGRVLFRNFSTGEEIPFSWNAFSVPDTETGGIAAIACVSKDLRETEKRQSIVDAEQSKLLSLLSQMPIGVCLLEGPNHKYTFANPRYYDLFNGERNLIGKTVIEALPELVGSELPKILDSVYQTGTPFYGNEFAVDIADVHGTLRSLFLNFAYEPMRASNGSIYGISVTVTDVTNFVRGRKVLEQKDARLELALNAGKIGTWDLDPVSKELFWSERGAEMYGFHGLTVTSYETFMNRVHPADRERVATNISASTTADGSSTYEIEYRIVLPNGNIRTIQADGLTVFEDIDGIRQPTQFTGTVIDVTDQVNSRSDLLAARDVAENANIAKSAFLANMSHEIRSPLGSIMGFSDLLKSGDISLADVSQYVSVIDRNSNHLLRIIDDILDLAKVEAGKMSIEHVDFSLHDLLADFSSLMGFRARDKGIEFKLRVPTPIPSLISSDPTRLRQILTNVVGNAIKFTEQGRVQLTVTFENGIAQFTVSDTGAGISPEQAEELFQPFHQADVSTTRKFGGTGLGLVLTRRLTEAMGGSFELQRSALGQGSVFVAKVRVSVPATAKLIDSSQELAFDERPKGEAKIKGVQSLRGLKVLVVDDAPDNQELFKLLLKKAGANIDIATNGFEGMNTALTNTYDVVLMDVQMPVMDGHQATQQLRAKGYSVPIIALTAHAMVEERERAVNSGFTDFISKPVHRDALISMLQQFVPGH